MLLILLMHSDLRYPDFPLKSDLFSPVSAKSQGCLVVSKRCLNSVKLRQQCEQC